MCKSLRACVFVFIYVCTFALLVCVSWCVHTRVARVGVSISHMGNLKSKLDYECVVVIGPYHKFTSKFLKSFGGLTEKLIAIVPPGTHYETVCAEIKRMPFTRVLYGTAWDMAGAVAAIKSMNLVVDLCLVLPSDREMLHVTDLADLTFAEALRGYNLYVTVPWGICAAFASNGVLVGKMVFYQNEYLLEYPSNLSMMMSSCGFVGMIKTVKIEFPKIQVFGCYTDPPLCPTSDCEEEAIRLCKELAKNANRHIQGILEIRF